MRLKGGSMRLKETHMEEKQNETRDIVSNIKSIKVYENVCLW